MLFLTTHILLSAVFVLLLVQLPRATPARVRGTLVITTIALVALLILTAAPGMPRYWVDSPLTMGIVLVLTLVVAGVHVWNRNKTNSKNQGA
jgi:hypothetical protein